VPATRPATVRRADLPEIATVCELARWARCDPRTLRAEIAAGNVAGAFRIGRSWRIDMTVYDAAKARTVT